MDSYTVFTNNSVAAEYFEMKSLPIEVKWIAAPAMEVLSAARTAARQGAVILSNPLSGVRTSSPLFSQLTVPKPLASGRGAAPKISSINPYLSILASPQQNTVDFNSVKRIDDALALYKKNARLRFVAHNDDTIKAFQAADLEMILATLANVANQDG